MDKKRLKYPRGMPRDHPMAEPDEDTLTRANVNARKQILDARFRAREAERRESGY